MDKNKNNQKYTKLTNSVDVQLLLTVNKRLW